MSRSVCNLVAPVLGSYAQTLNLLVRYQLQNAITI